MRVVIIGSAGHHVEDKKYLDSQLYTKVVNQVDQKIQPWKNIHLISGGAAFVDHVAISLFLKHVTEGAKLTLFLPCEFDCQQNQFAECHPGPIATKEHRDFEKRTGIESLVEITKAIKLGAKVRVVSDLKIDPKGWHARNMKIAASVSLDDSLFAFTWYAGSEPKPDSGTRRTWDMTKCSKQYFSLFQFI